jgi:hypothetical protein
MNPLLLDIVLYFVSLNLVAGDGIDCFRDFSPESPDNIIVLSEYGGSEVPYYDEAAHRSVQVKVRDTDADTARQKALQLFKALKSDTKFIRFTETRWGQVTLRQTPFKIEQDENKRTIYGFNMGITTSIE